MKILVTGAKGFVGKNLCAALKNLKVGKDKTRPALSIEEIFEYDIDSNPADLEYCSARQTALLQSWAQTQTMP